MRLIRITTNYPTYLKQFYNQNSELKQQPYHIQYQTLMADCFGWADYWTHALGKLGYEVWETVGNAEPMQKAWAKEQGITYQEKTWLTDIITAQVKQFKPDIVFVNDYTTYKLPFFNHLRQECSSIRFIVGWCGAPYADETVFKAYDLVLSNIPILVDQFRENGHKSEFFRHGFDARILNKLNLKQGKKIDFSFIGSIQKNNNFHLQRENLLKSLVAATPLEIWADTPQPSRLEKQTLPVKQGIYYLIQGLKFMPGMSRLLEGIPKVNKYVTRKNPPDLSHYVDQSLAQRAHSPLYGLAMFQKLSESKITFNNHIDIAAQFASNMRLYEATGVGTCLLTDWQADLKDVFEPDVEVVTYHNVEEGIEKVNYLLNHEEERKAIAQAGQKRTLRDHSFEQRAIALDQIMKNAIGF